MTDCDVAIAGAGPVACALAAALAEAPLSAVRIGSETAAANRPIALSHGSRLLLERLRVWNELASTPIHVIHVSQRGRFGRAVMRASEQGLPALGYVAPYADVLAPLLAASPSLQGSLVDWNAEPERVMLRVRSASGENVMSAKLLVLAEGGATAPAQEVREYDQRALVAEVSSERRHANTAWERFTAEGPLALLPFGERLALVWTARPASAARLLEASDAAFLRQLRDAFGGRLGEFRDVAARSAFPVALRARAPLVASRTLVIGNAAQSLHPVAGQGLNLGLRDAWELAELLRSAAPDEIGHARFLARYARRRNLDRRAAIVVTDSLARMFANSSPLLAPVRGAGLAALDLLPSPRRFFARRMMYGARALP
jgi:2-octaprenyl-6-methoxyphenol hydroxylase